MHPPPPEQRYRGYRGRRPRLVRRAEQAPAERTLLTRGLQTRPVVSIPHTGVPLVNRCYDEPQSAEGSFNGRPLAVEVLLYVKPSRLVLPR